MNKQVNTPTVRFPGFDSEWEEEQLGNHLALKRGLTYSPNSVRNNGVRVLRSSNIFEDRFVLRSDDVFVAPEAVNVDRASDNDILITAANGSTRLVGKHCIIKGVEVEPSVPGGFMLLGKTDCPSFTQALLGARWYERFINRNVAGGNGAIGNLRPNDLSSELVTLPSIPEQQKIGELFENLDALIDLQQKELQKLRQLKSAMLSKMFPKPGATVPEIRFPGFDDVWDEREFGSVFLPLKSRSHSRAELSSTAGEVQNIHYGDILVKYGSVVDCNTSELPYVIGANRAEFAGHLLTDGDIIFADAAEDESVGKAIELTGIDHRAVIAGLHTIPCRPALSFSRGYLGYYFNAPAYRHQLLSLMQGTKVLSISRGSLSRTTVMLPSLPEQQKIGEFFENLDSLIDLEIKKGEKLSQVKRSLLSKMFA